MNYQRFSILDLLLFSEQQLLTFRRNDCWMRYRSKSYLLGNFAYKPKKAKSESCHNTMITTKLTSVSIDYYDRLCIFVESKWPFFLPFHHHMWLFFNIQSEDRWSKWLIGVKAFYFCDFNFFSLQRIKLSDPFRQ